MNSLRFLKVPARALAVVLAVTLAPAVAVAQKDAAGGGTDVLAKVNGHAITAADVDDAILKLPPQYQSLPRETLVPAVVSQLIDRHLVASRARGQKLDVDPDIKRAMQQQEDWLLEQVYLRRLVEGKLDERTLRRQYERDKVELSTGKQVRARHILVKTREEAMDILRELSRGKDFAELAREKSIGPSKTQGGDLGYFAREAMLPAFSNVAFSLKKGEVSRAPVQTRYGWHVIKVEDIREAGPPPFDEVKDDLRAKMGDALVEKEIKRLREGAKIERFGPAARSEEPAAPSPN